MPKCILLDESSLNIIHARPASCVLVDMFYVGYSTGPALFTYGANPCLAVVIHNTRTDTGVMAHIVMTVALSNWTLLRDTVYTRILSIITWLGFESEYNKLQVFLFGATDLADRAGENFPRYLARVMPAVELFDKLDYPPLLRIHNPNIGRNAAQVLYWPAEHIVAELDLDELRYLQGRRKESLSGVTLKLY